MRFLLSFMLFGFTSLLAQVNTSITVGQSMKKVLSEMNRDDAADHYNVKKSNNVITVSVKMESPLNKQSIVQYYFKDNVLIKIKWTNSVPKPDGMMSFIYQNHVTSYGEPQITKIDGYRAYLWKFPGKIGFHYFYKGYSDWFQRVCFINVITLKII